MDKGEVSFKLKNHASELETLYQHLKQFGTALGLPRKIMLHSKLAIDELFTNIITHGYTNDAEHWIEVTMSHKDGTLILRIEDDGVVFNPLKAEKPDIGCSLEECKIGGVGIHLAKHFIKDINYQRVGNKNVVTLIMNFKEA